MGDKKSLSKSASLTQGRRAVIRVMRHEFRVPSLEAIILYIKLARPYDLINYEKFVHIKAAAIYRNKFFGHTFALKIETIEITILLQHNYK